MTEPDRWCTATFDKLNDDVYPPFLRDRMKQDPSYGLAREILAQMAHESNNNIEYNRALKRVTELAESDRDDIIHLFDDEVFWRTLEQRLDPLPSHCKGFKWQQLPNRQ